MITSLSPRYNIHSGLMDEINFFMLAKPRCCALELPVAPVPSSDSDLMSCKLAGLARAVSAASVCGCELCD
jgi:hypothetical protein